MDESRVVAARLYPPTTLAPSEVYERARIAPSDAVAKLLAPAMDRAADGKLVLTGYAYVPADAPPKFGSLRLLWLSADGSARKVPLRARAHRDPAAPASLHVLAGPDAESWASELTSLPALRGTAPSSRPG